MCGSGKDLGKWQRAKPARYVGIGARGSVTRAYYFLHPLFADPQDHATKEAQKRWEGREKPFDATFVAADPFQVSALDFGDSAPNTI